MGNEKQGRLKTQNPSKLQRSRSCLKQGSEMNAFCLKHGQGLKASAAHPRPNFPNVPSPPG